MNKEDVVIRGNEAEYLLNSPVLRDAFDSIEATCVHAWKVSFANEEDKREKLFQMVSVVNEVKKQLMDYFNQATLIKANRNEPDFE